MELIYILICRHLTHVWNLSFRSVGLRDQALQLNGSNCSDNMDLYGILSIGFHLKSIKIQDCFKFLPYIYVIVQWFFSFLFFHEIQVLGSLKFKQLIRWWRCTNCASNWLLLGPVSFFPDSNKINLMYRVALFYQTWTLERIKRVRCSRYIYFMFQEKSLNVRRVMGEINPHFRVTRWGHAAVVAVQ